MIELHLDNKTRRFEVESMGTDGKFIFLLHEEITEFEPLIPFLEIHIDENNEIFFFNPKTSIIEQYLPIFKMALFGNRDKWAE